MVGLLRMRFAEPVARPNDEEREHRHFPPRSPLARSSSSVSFALGRLHTHTNMNTQTESPARAKQVSVAVVFFVTWLMTWLLLGCFHDFSSYISYDGAQTLHTLKRASGIDRVLYSLALSGILSLVHAKLVSVCARFAPVFDRIADRILRLF